MSEMAARDSRYRYAGDVARVDASGRALVATVLRRRPRRSGVYQHTLTQGERLDHLGQTYYRRPHRWWEICDANPATLSPLTLIGDEPVRQARMTVPVGGPAVLWQTVLDGLLATPGVERVALADATAPAPGAGPDVAVTLLTVWFNELSTPLADLQAAIAAHGPTAPLTLLPGPEGSTIVVPPPSGRG